MYATRSYDLEEDLCSLFHLSLSVVMPLIQLCDTMRELRTHMQKARNEP